MNRGLESKRDAKSLISSIKRINDNPNGLTNNSYDNQRDDLGLDKTKRTINDFSSKTKGRTNGVRDIFSEVLDTVDEILGTYQENTPDEYPSIQSKSLRYSKIAGEKALAAGKQIIINAVKSGYFSGEGGCSSNSVTTTSSYELSPKNFDFTNMLKVNPSSASGKLMYETLPDDGIGVQFNRKLYEKFDSPSSETIYEKDGTTSLFDISWDSATQRYTITTGAGVSVSDFITEYYNTIEIPSISNVMQNAMMMTIQGDGTEAASFNVGMDYMNRLLTKLFAVCGSAKKNQSPFLQNTTNLILEDESDIQDYFNFDDVDGIDLDDENARKRRVLKFRDCNNFEIPTNSNHIEDFSFLSSSKNLDENINDTLKKVAIDAYEQAESSIYLEGFEISIMKSYILQIPRALVSVLLSPKMIFPIALSYQMLNPADAILEVKAMMKKLGNVFFDIIKTVFWTFIKEFWSLAKKDVLEFVKDLAIYIVLNRIKRIKAIVLALINLLLRALDGSIQSCTEIFDTILRVLQSALNRSVKIPVPGLLLVLSEGLPGFSADRAYMDALQRMEDAGINTGDIYGSENKLPSLVKSMIDAYSNEMDTNSYVKIALKPAVIPAGPGGAVISPLVSGSGKLF